MASLSVRYRCKSLEEVIGNESVIKGLSKVLNRSEDKLPHAYLLTGDAGTGKSVVARIIASSLGCDSSFDFREMDAADFRGIDTIRSIREHISLSPMKSKCRVWFLDECHQLTNDAQEGLLKAIEDPPSTAFFILATTEPEKLKASLKRRCVTYHLSTIDEETIIEYLKRVCEQESSSLTLDVLEYIAKESKGSLGVALSLLELVIDTNDKRARKILEDQETVESQTIDLCRALIKKKSWKEVAAIITSLEKEEPEKIRRHVCGYFYKVLLNSGSPDAYLVLDAFKEPYYVTGKIGLVLSCYAVSRR